MISVSRQEMKYLMTYQDSVRLQSELEQILDVDPYSQAAPDGSYCIRSLYFDSPDGMDYTDKYAGVENRKKVRLRIYDPQAVCAKFEVKYKSGDDQKKDSIVVPRKEAEMYSRGEYWKLLDHPEKEAAELYAILTLGAYQPAAIVEYRRRAYTYPDFDTRITFDTKVQSSELNLDLFDEHPAYFPVLTDRVILEVKFNQYLAESIKRILAKYNLTRTAVSKYGMCRPIRQHDLL